MTDFKPYEKEEEYKVVLTKDEALLIQKLRQIGYGSVTVHMVGGKIIRLETIHSELSKDRKSDTVTIALEVIGK